ncbi:MAG: GNAT family N-acetyltransferase [Phycisphaerae bacterium]|nr:GNAT family N-acetyltransferase [Phycisphaerae bacterium]
MEYIQVIMLRESLDEIPQYRLPAGYGMRLYRTGDKATWVRLQQASEQLIKITDRTFEGNFGSDLPAMPRRCHFLTAPDGRDVGTITAWYDRSYRGRRWGRIHWVAIVPEHRGRGLSKPMMTVAMRRLRSLGHRRALLTTQAPRLAAIKTYLDFGFWPDMTAHDAARAWKLIRKQLPHPMLASL